jgi:hypothetical protein
MDERLAARVAEAGARAYVGDGFASPLLARLGAWLLYPLAMFYTHGPALVGGWGGLPLADICASMASTPSARWQLHGDECLELVTTRFASLVACGLCVLYVWALYRLGGWLLRSCEACLAPPWSRASPQALDAGLLLEALAGAHRMACVRGTGGALSPSPSN